MSNKQETGKETQADIEQKVDSIRKTDTFEIGNFETSTKMNEPGLAPLGATTRDLETI